MIPPKPDTGFNETVPRKQKVAGLIDSQSL